MRGRASARAAAVILTCGLALPAANELHSECNAEGEDGDVVAVPAEETAGGDGESWLGSRVLLTGDAFLRFEAVRKAPNPETRDFERVRLRLRPGAEMPFLSGRLTAGAGVLASIASDSNAENPIRFDNFWSDEVALDRAYLRVSGAETPFAASIGVFETPFAGSEVLWDKDIRFLGASAGIELSPAGRLAAQRAYGGISIGSQNDEDESLMAAARWEGESGGGWSFGTGFWLAGNTKALVEAGYARTNRLAPGGEEYLSDFQIANITLGWEKLGERRPFRVRLDLMHNFGADDLRSGGDLRVDWGELQARGSWRLRLMLQRVEQDAVLAAFGGDEWWFKTRHRGARLGFAAAFSRDAFIEISALRQRRDDLDEWLDRGFVDLVLLF